jgi:hypothetical protein
VDFSGSVRHNLFFIYLISCQVTPADLFGIILFVFYLIVCQMTSADPFGVVLWPAAQCIAAHLLVPLFFLPLSFLLYFYYRTFAAHLRVRITLLFTHFTDAFTVLLCLITVLVPRPICLHFLLYYCTSHFTTVLVPWPICLHFSLYFSLYVLFNLLVRPISLHVSRLLFTHLFSLIRTRKALRQVRDIGKSVTDCQFLASP